MTTKVNNAVIVPFAMTQKIRRVVTITEDGRAVVHPLDGDPDVLLESEPGAWPVCGHYIQTWTRAGIWPFNSEEQSWEFLPCQPIPNGPSQNL
jgi:hypothetical protein